MFGPKQEAPDPSGAPFPGSYSRRIRPGANVGKANGLTLLLDTETYDYSYHHRASEGFKVAVMHHLDQPLMAIKELDVSPGFESQIAVTPILYDTTPEAKER